jgi:hypothetical protein
MQFAARVNGQWSEWNEWGSCIVACGSGIRTADRNCDNPAPANGGSHCLGPSTRTSMCQGPPCYGKHAHGTGTLFACSF